MSTLAEIHADVAARLTTLTAEAAKLGISRWALSSAMRNKVLPTLKACNRPAGVLAAAPMHRPGLAAGGWRLRGVEQENLPRLALPP